MPDGDSSCNVAAATQPNLLMDKLDEAFQHCMSLLVKEESFSTQDRDSLRAHAESSVTNFMDCARQLEQNFLQNRLLLSVHRPEWVLKEETQELRLELARKDELIRANQQKIVLWKNMLADVTAQHTTTTTAAAGGAAGDISSAEHQQRMMTPGVSSAAPAATMMYRSGPLGVGAMGRAPVPPAGMSPGVQLPAGPMSGGASLAGHLACLEKATSSIGAQDGATGQR